MPRKPIWPPPVHHHKPTGQARVRIRGRDYYLGKYGSPEAQAEYARLVAELAAGAVPAPKGAAPALTVADVVASWWEQAEKEYSERGRELDQFRFALPPLLRLYGHTPARDFDADRLETVRQAMASGSWMSEEEKAQAVKRKRPVGWCRNVVNRRVVRIRTVWRWAEGKKVVPKGSWAGLCVLRGLGTNSRAARQTEKPKPAEWGELRRVLRRCPPAPRAMLLLQWWAGMRSGEVRVMRPCDIDRSGPVWVYRPPQHKNDWRGHERAVPLGRKCQAVLGPWLRDCPPQNYLFRPGRGARSDHYSAFAYGQVVRRAAEAAGIEGFHPYRCRHAAKQRITRELGLDAARAVLGQRSIGTTNDYAAGVDLKTATDAARKTG